jgi:glucuronoarabinoxylan endo-1,4-beta-xylanase
MTSTALSILFWMFCSTAAPAQNLVTNPGFETGNTSGWFAFGSCTISAESSVVHSGQYAALVSNRTATWNGIAQQLEGVLQPGQTYNVSAWLQLASGTNQTMSLTVQQVDASGTSYPLYTASPVTTNGWTQIGGTFTLLVSGTLSSLILYAEMPSSANIAYYIDDVSVTQPNGAPGAGQCTVDWASVFQRIDGFGASSAWDGNWTTNQADMFFSTNSGKGTTVDGTTNFAFNGVGLSLLRNRIAPDGTTVETNIMQWAQQRGARVWSTPWSPPAIYKNTNSVNGGNFVSSPANYQGYANQLAGYVASMKTNYGVNLYAVSVQNEPDESTTYESCLWTAQQIHDFVPYLAAALTNAGVASTQIMLPEDSNWNYDYSLATTAMTDPSTAAQVGIVAAHDYGGSDAILNNYGKPLWETEVSTSDTFDGSISNGVYWAGQVYDLLTIAQVNAWHYWWLIPYATDNESLVDTNGNPAKRLYTLGNYSRFVRPGFYRVGVSNNSPALITAFRDSVSGNFAIVAVNDETNDLQVAFSITGLSTPTLTPWVTSATLSLSNQAPVGVTNSAFSYDLPPVSVVTFTGVDASASPGLNISAGGNGVILTIHGPAGMQYTLYSSTDLSTWQEVLTTNPPTMPISWTDTNASPSSKFYSAQYVP